MEVWLGKTGEENPRTTQILSLDLIPVGQIGVQVSAMMRMLGMSSESNEVPWKKPAPKKSSHTKLTAESKAETKATAKAAGRPYPNLVDNMNAARKQREKPE